MKMIGGGYSFLFLGDNFHINYLVQLKGCGGDVKKQQKQRRPAFV